MVVGVLYVLPAAEYFLRRFIYQCRVRSTGLPFTRMFDQENQFSIAVTQMIHTMNNYLTCIYSISRPQVLTIIAFNGCMDPCNAYFN